MYTVTRNYDRAIKELSQKPYEKRFATLTALIERCTKDGVTEIEFKASDLGFNGNALCGLKGYGFLKIIGKEECWYKIDDETMKKGYTNIYRFRLADVDPKLFEDIKEAKVQKIEKRIERLKASLLNAYNELDKI